MHRDDESCRQEDNSLRKSSSLLWNVSENSLPTPTVRGRGDDDAVTEQTEAAHIGRSSKLQEMNTNAIRQPSGKRGHFSGKRRKLSRSVLQSSQSTILILNKSSKSRRRRYWQGTVGRSEEATKVD